MKGKELTEIGLAFNNENTRIVHIKLKSGEIIKPHDHVDELVYFVVVRGVVKVYLDHEEFHEMTPGKILSFDGVTTISAETQEDSEIFVFLIKK